MRFSVAGGDGFDQGTDALVRLMRKDEKDEHLEKTLGGALASLRERKVFEGKEGQVSVLPMPEGGGPRFAILAGMGDAATPESVRCASALAAKRARAERLGSIAVSASSLVHEGLDAREAAQAVVEGAGLGLYRMDKYKKADGEEKTEVSRAVLCGGPGGNLSAMRRGVRYGRALCEGTNYARDLINTPSNEKRPPALAEMARKMARREGLRCRVLDEKQMERMKMGALLSVGRGSSEPPRMVILEYRPQGVRTKPIAFVGKGVTFDTGGISIKPSGGLELMTTDMSGAAAVLGAMLAVARAKPRVPVVGVAGLVENMVDGDATRPGDIVRSMKGTTVEIHNTDAEGRLVLADALHYTREKYKPQCMIDLATLTGACMVALGQKVTGMYGTHDELLERVPRPGRTHRRPRLAHAALPGIRRGDEGQDRRHVQHLGRPLGGREHRGGLFCSTSPTRRPGCISTSRGRLIPRRPNPTAPRAAPAWACGFSRSLRRRGSDSPPRRARPTGVRGPCEGVRTKRRRASSTRFLTDQATAHCKPLQAGHSARAALVLVEACRHWAGFRLAVAGRSATLRAV